MKNLLDFDFSSLLNILGSKHLIAFIMTLLFSYFVASTGGAYIGSQLIKPQKRARPSGSVSASFKFKNKTFQDKVIYERNIFDPEKLPLPEDLERQKAKDAANEKEKEETPKEVDYSVEAVKSNLKFRVLGTIYGGSPTKGIAVVSVKGKKDINSYMVGDVIGKVAKLVQVLREKIIFEHNGRLEYLMVKKKTLKRRRRKRRKKGSPRPRVSRVEQVAPVAEAKEVIIKDGFERRGGASKITQAFRDRFLNEKLGETLRAAKASPVVERGGIVGWKMTRIKPNSIYKLIGLKENDIISEINGTKLNDAGKAVSFLNSLRDESHISIKVRRGGKQMSLSIDLQ